MDQKAIIEFKEVSFSYPGSRPLFKALTFEFKSNAFYLIKGPSGAGKSSLLRLLNRLEEPSSGEIFFNHLPLSSYHPPELRRRILYIQQTPTVIDGSVRDNLLLPFDFKNNNDLTRPDDDHLLTRLKDFRLTNVSLEHNAQNLSVGQLQRVCFIRGILLFPEIILLDEPTSALDKESRKIVESSAERLCCESGSTVIMVSHNTFVPKKVTPIVLDITDGRIMEI